MLLLVSKSRVETSTSSKEQDMGECEVANRIVGEVADPFPAISQRRRGGVRVSSAAAVALGLVVTGESVGAAPRQLLRTASIRAGHRDRRSGPTPPGRGLRRPTAAGTVKSVGNGSFAVTTRDGTTVTVLVDTTTDYFGAGVPSPTMANVKVGEHIAVFGSDRSELVTADRVAIGRPPFIDRGGTGRPHPTRSGSTPS
jgi:hypothetical protein